MRFTICQDSRIGQRTINQDRIAYSHTRDALLMLVADGLGGHPRGEVAAQLAAQVVSLRFHREARPTLADPLQFLADALAGTHLAIQDYTLENGLAESPRTTVVVCVVQHGLAYWAHAGDSRLYLLRQGRIHTRTRDHSETEWMLERGLISSPEAPHYPRKNHVFSCLGGDHLAQIEFAGGIALQQDDLILLCSDGLWNPLGDEGLVRALQAPLPQAVLQLMEQAESLAGANADNLSLVAMRWHGPVLDAATASVPARAAFSDQATQPGAVPESAAALDEATIDRAINEINTTLQSTASRQSGIQETHAPQSTSTR